MDFQLTSGERVIWRGNPACGIRFHAYDFFLVPFAFVWLAGALTIFVAPESRQQDADPIGYVMLPFFVLIGIYILFGRFVTDFLVRSRTEYALTNRRAIIESGYFRRIVRSVNLAAAPEIRFQEKRNGRGTIEFGSGAPFGMPRGWPGMGQFQPPAFDGIEDARNVYELALNAQHEAQAKAN
jgi:hypothetical protein